MPIPPSTSPNPTILRECLSTPILRKALLPPPDKKKHRHQHVEVTSSDAAELADFVDYLSEELFTSLPTTLQNLHPTSLIPPALPNLNFLPPSLLDSLITYELVDSLPSAERLIEDILREYIEAATAPPPIWSHTKTTECEICEREVPLTYHHLIPREVHKKVLKKGWHEEWKLNSVAWLCRPCHSFVHKCASNEELAREWWSVERLREREDVRRWAGFVGKQRWKGVR